MGMLVGGFFSQAVAAAGAVTVSGETVTDNVAVNRLARAAIVVRSDGTIDKIENATVTQIDSGTDWIIPNGDASSLYEVKYDLDIGDTLDASTDLADGIWGALGADKFFEQRATFYPDQDRASTITISIRFNGGSVLDSATFILEAQAITI